MEPNWMELAATFLFGLAILHTFCTKFFLHLSRRYRPGSIGENFFHILAEVEVVFGLWAGVFITGLWIKGGAPTAIEYLQALNFTEPVFIFVIMTVCSTRPIISATTLLITWIARLLPLNPQIAFYCTTLVLGPALGSLITEPAAMTVCALILLKRYFNRGIPQPFKYATIGLLFVNISIGGTWTPYAAPPILMVAPAWGWDLGHMAAHFGWKGGIASLLATAWVAWRYREELRRVEIQVSSSSNRSQMPLWIILVHLGFLAAIVATAHYMVVFVGIFLFFLGLANVTREYQSTLKIKEGLLVAFFLGGLVVLGKPQSWWLTPILTQLGSLEMFLGATVLTAFTDNAALTYLGAQVPSLSEATRYALVAGAVVGGGMTVIANAPNPAGYGILSASFGKEGISPLGLAMSAAVPTLIAGLCYWLL